MGDFGLSFAELFKELSVGGALVFNVSVVRPGGTSVILPGRDIADGSCFSCGNGRRAEEGIGLVRPGMSLKQLRQLLNLMSFSRVLVAQPARELI